MDFSHIDHTEQNFNRDNELRDRMYNERTERDMRELIIEQEEARHEAAVLAQWPVTCDGSGIIDEFYIDVDQTQVIACKGCPACDLELVEFRGRRKPMAVEAGDVARKEVA